MKNKRVKMKTHKGAVKRLIVRLGGIKIRHAGINKYATKRSNRNRQSRMHGTLMRLHKSHFRQTRKLMCGRLGKLR